MVGDTGIEPVTPSMSTKCSTAELITHLYERDPRAPTKKWGAKAPRRLGAIKGVASVIKGFWLCNKLRYVFYDKGDQYARFSF
jgi:hypothetical protein